MLDFKNSNEGAWVRGCNPPCSETLKHVDCEFYAILLPNSKIYTKRHWNGELMVYNKKVDIKFSAHDAFLE